MLMSVLSVQLHGARLKASHHESFISSLAKSPCCKKNPPKKQKQRLHSQQLLTHLSLRRMVISHQGEDDHGDEVGNHADVEGDGTKLLPFGPQQLVDGLHRQHLVAVLTSGIKTHDADKQNQNKEIRIFAHTHTQTDRESFIVLGFLMHPHTSFFMSCLVFCSSNSSDLERNNISSLPF